MHNDFTQFCIFVFLKKKSNPYNTLINQYVQQYTCIYMQTKSFITYLQNTLMYLNKVTIHLKSKLNTYNTYSQHNQNYQKDIWPETKIA